MSLVGRNKKLPFFGIPSGSITRMKNFTSFSISKNPKEYTRQYIDEAFEQSDVVGYSPSIEYGFDLDDANTVHADIVGITDGEKKGDDAVRYIYIVDMTDEISAGVYACRKRSFAVIPDGEGDSSDAYTYSGNFKVKGDIIEGTASTTDAWQTITFTPDSGAEYLVTFSVSDLSGQIAGAEITINSQVIQTDENGIAEIVLPNATYSYVITKTGYTNGTGSVTVASGAEFVEKTLTAA